MTRVRWTTDAANDLSRIVERIRKDGRITEGHIYIRSFLTHKQYDNPSQWDKGVTK